MGEADEAYTLVDFLDTVFFVRPAGGDVDLLAAQADAPADGDENVATVQRMPEFGQTAAAAA